MTALCKLWLPTFCITSPLQMLHSPGLLRTPPRGDGQKHKLWASAAELLGHQHGLAASHDAGEPLPPSCYTSPFVCSMQAPYGLKSAKGFWQQSAVSQTPFSVGGVESRRCNDSGPSWRISSYETNEWVMSCGFRNTGFTSYTLSAFLHHRTQVMLKALNCITSVLSPLCLQNLQNS